MNRADKIRLLREIESGTKFVSDFLAPKWIEMVQYDTRPDVVRYNGKFITRREAGAICREANEERKRNTRVIWIEVKTYRDPQDDPHC